MRSAMFPFFILIKVLCADQSVFDLKLIERNQKKDIPWSLTGSAADLRSDIKHEIQKIMNRLTLLWPEAPWNKEDEKASMDEITASFDALKNYIQTEGRDDKVRMVLDSIDYIINTYGTSVQNKLASAKESNITHLDKKRELLPLLIDQMKQGYQQLQDQAKQKKVLKI